MQKKIKCRKPKSSRRHPLLKFFSGQPLDRQSQRGANGRTDTTRQTDYDKAYMLGLHVAMHIEYILLCQHVLAQ